MSSPGVASIRKVLGLFVLVSLFFVPPAQSGVVSPAEGANTAAPLENTSVVPVVKTAVKNAEPKTSKGKFREKEAEGTQAPNRFQADGVIKSQYELNGEPLEVDPD